jgi:hypothetical protein
MLVGKLEESRGKFKSRNVSQIISSFLIV